MVIRVLGRAWPAGATTAFVLAAGALGIGLAGTPTFAAVWVKDAQSGCATSNPFPNPNESIRWFGNCRDGKLDGRGTLVWYRDGNETERNEGTFKDGEMDGYVVTTYPEGYVVHGQYAKGQRHGQFMTIRGSTDYVRAIYYNGALSSQARLSPQEIADWTRRGGPVLIANAPPPDAPAAKPQATQAAASGDDEGPVTGRTAVSSPSRSLAPPPKAAAAPPARPKPQVAAAPQPATAPSAAPSAAPTQPGGSGFILGTQVIDAIQPANPPAAYAAPAAAPAPAVPPAAAPSVAPVAAPAAAPLAAAVAAPVAAAVAAPAAVATSVPVVAPVVAPVAAPPPGRAAPAQLAQAAPAEPARQEKEPGGFYLSGPSLTSPPLPGGSSGSAKSVKATPQPAAAPSVAATQPIPTPQPAGAQRYQMAAPQPAQAAAPPPPLLPTMPAGLPTSGTIASPSLPGLPATATQPVVAQGQVSSGSGRRPPWMGAGSGDPVLVAGGPVPGQTPPPLATPMAAAPLAGPAQPYTPPVYTPPPAAAGQGYQPPMDYSPTAASRQYLAQREAAEAAWAMSQQAQQQQAMYGAAYPQGAYPQGAYPQAAYPQPAYPAQLALQQPGSAVPGATGTITNLAPGTLASNPMMYPAGSAEAMFKDGYKAEMSGKFREAEQIYEQIIVSLPNTQTAMLANDRLNNLRRNTREQSVRIAEQPRGGLERQGGVVTVNEPRNLPRYAQPTGAQPVQLSDSGSGDASGGMTANLTGVSVCSQRGMYDKESRWCGIVLADDGARLSVEIKDVVLPGFGNVGIQSSKCTGGTFINWFARGTMVRVPRSCMELKG